MLVSLARDTSAQDCTSPWHKSHRNLQANENNKADFENEQIFELRSSQSGHRGGFLNGNKMVFHRIWATQPAGRSSSCGGCQDEGRKWTLHTHPPEPEGGGTSRGQEHQLSRCHTLCLLHPPLLLLSAATLKLQVEYLGSDRTSAGSPQAECPSDRAQSPAELQVPLPALHTAASPEPGGASPPAEGGKRWWKQSQIQYLIPVFKLQKGQ